MMGPPNEYLSFGTFQTKDVARKNILNGLITITSSLSSRARVHGVAIVKW
jgi:hypothetical protein